jgi:tripartite-type tricarboxylate transporter receptor subunit TctC
MRFPDCAYPILTVIGMMAAVPGFAQIYPERPVRVVVPFPPGGNLDISGRIVAQALSEQLAQSFVVDNRGGAGGMIGAEVVAKAAPEGYTLLLGGSGPTTISPLLYSKPPYDPVRDFAPISLLSLSAIVVLAHPSIPARNLRELIALAKSRPGSLILASAGTGTSSHLSGELLQQMAGIRMTHVPYKGGGPAIVDLVGGQVDLMCEQVTATIGYVRQGKLRAVAVTTKSRIAVLPDVQTVAEAGVKGYEATSYTGLFAPAGTPRPVISRLHAEVARALDNTGVRERFAVLGSEAKSMPPAEFDAYLRDELLRWAKVIKLANVRVN